MSWALYKLIGPESPPLRILRRNFKKWIKLSENKYLLHLPGRQRFSSEILVNKKFIISVIVKICKYINYKITTIKQIAHHP